MEDMNKCVIIGRLKADPVLRQFTSSRKAEGRVEVSIDNRTSSIPISAWGELADRLSGDFKTGSPIYVEGRFANQSWEKDGVKQWKSEIVAIKIENPDAEDAGPVNTAPEDLPF
jgi:single-stranded DNA-binding protein